MRITEATCHIRQFKLKQSALSGEVFYENVFLTLKTDTGLTGHGIASPDRVITGEDAQSVMMAFEDSIHPTLVHKNPFLFSRIYEDLREMIPGQATALAMVEIALYDLLAQAAGVPLYMLLGGFREKIITSVSIGIGEDKEVLEIIQHWTDQGIRAFKIRGGSDVDRDIRICELVRRQVGPETMLIFDANKGYNLIEAAHFIRHVHKVNLEIFEQPTSPELTFQWHLLRQESSTPIMADESLKKLADSFILTSHQSVDMLNIKLMKVGGITPALQINSSARSADVSCMMGCMNECSLGIAAGLHVALARPNITHADLDSWLHIEDDPFAGLVVLDNGYLKPNGQPGIGVIYQ